MGAGGREAPEDRARVHASPHSLSPQEGPRVQAPRQNGAFAAVAFVSAARSRTLSCAPAVFWARGTLFRRVGMGKREGTAPEWGVLLQPLRASWWQRERVGEELCFQNSAWWWQRHWTSENPPVFFPAN